MAAARGKPYLGSYLAREIGYGAFDVFMCGDADPWRAVDVLKAAFRTSDVRVRELLRAAEGLVDAVGACGMTEWMRETLDMTTTRKALARGREGAPIDSATDHQRLRRLRECANSGSRRWVLTLDDVVQTTEGDNFNLSRDAHPCADLRAWIRGTRADHRRR